MIQTVSEVRAVTKISIFWVNATSREGMIQLGISFFPSNFYERSWGSHLYLPLMTAVQVITDVEMDHPTRATSLLFLNSSVGSNTASMFLPVFFNALVGSPTRD